MTDRSLAVFSDPTRAWFESSFPGPTPAQAQAWQAIGTGEHVLVVAPTGSGKTLAAFLWAIDRLLTEPRDPAPRGPRIVYVSPLKALGIDVQRNLRAPLVGIRHAAERLGLPVRDVRVAVRSGDTSPSDRRRLATHPPDVLITTPESLYLMLTSRVRESLRFVETVVIDEIHALCATKRGAHLALSMERLDWMLDRPAQRIGLSATVRPVRTVAHFLSGAGAGTAAVVQPPVAKQVDVSVVVPVPDMTDPDVPDGDDLPPGSTPSIWPSVERRILDLVLTHSSTLVFANSRRLAERLSTHLNERAAGTAGGSPGVIARAHHGSVSREQRLDIEEALKRGSLPAVVTTSSLELGIDMGAVDLVVQVEPPPSVAAGLQRVGRSGHQVGALSRGVIFPKHRGDLVPSAVAAARMARGEIEESRVVSNSLDVLAQHVVAMVAVEDWTVADLATVVRRAAPFEDLAQSAFEAVLDMLAGRYPSSDFAELRPRLVWNRATDTLSARPGALRLAVTSGGTIPDRGLFGVYLATGTRDDGHGPTDAARRRGGGRRVGELDEEMVYESRVGDVFLLGSTSWRILEITGDRVLVAPAPGEVGKTPFWHGDAPARPPELGRAIGSFVREIAGLSPSAADAALAEAGLDRWARDNLISYLDEQRAATGYLPDEKTVVVERFRDELGDWRLAIHTPLGSGVTAPWALLARARLRDALGVEVTSVHTDDGIMFRVPDSPDPPPTHLLLLDPDDIERQATAELAGSPLFAARFRECAARSLLLPPREPGRRAPLWQQRQRSATLLQVAARFPDFPVVLEAMRECLQDVFDLGALTALMRDVTDRRVRVVEADTPGPSPFARSLLFGYVGTFLYEGDMPLAERRAQALAVDSRILAELLGTTDLRELLDPSVLVEIEDEAQGRAGARRAHDVESTADLLTRVGDLTADEAAARGVRGDWLADLERARRAIRVRVAQQERWIAVEDAARYRDGLGCALPQGVPHAFLEPVDDPLADLVSRYAGTHAPFPAEQCAQRLGLGTAVVAGVLRRLRERGTVERGAYTPGGPPDEWVDSRVLRRIRRRSLARLRHEVEPVPTTVLGQFQPAWHHIGAPLRGHEGTYAAVELLQGVPLPASALETLVLPARVAGYDSRLLDELCAGGEVVWSGSGSLPGRDGWLCLAPTERAADLLPPPTTQSVPSALHAAIVAAIPAGDAVFFRTLLGRVRDVLDPLALPGSSEPGSNPVPDPVSDSRVAAALWDLVWDGMVTNDTLAPVRAHLLRRATSSGARGRAPTARRFSRLTWRTVSGPVPSTLGGRPDLAGRWSLVPERTTDPTRRLAALAEALLERHGVLTRGAVAAADVPGGFSALYPVLRTFEDAGHCRRGYFVEGLGAAQFALPGAPDRLRSFVAGLESEPGAAVVLAAVDPANPFGAAVPWPERVMRDPGAPPGGHKPARKAGAAVVLVDGRLTLYLERGGRTVLTWADRPDRLEAAARALAAAVSAGHLGTVTVASADGADVHSGPSLLGPALEAAGFRATPRGLRLRPSRAPGPQVGTGNPS